MARVKYSSGIFHITSTFLLLVVILIGIYIIYELKFERHVSHMNTKSHASHLRHEERIPEKIVHTAPVQVNVSRGGDDRYSVAPQPARNWLGGGIPTIATQGYPESYQSMGVVKTSSGELLPLYGRRVASRSDRFNYYTRTDTNNPIPLPVAHKRRDCQDDVGCEELFDGEHIEIIPTKQSGAVTIYRFNGPTYIPNVL